jgi:hypothetical protein
MADLPQINAKILPGSTILTSNKLVERWGGTLTPDHKKFTFSIVDESYNVLASFQVDSFQEAVAHYQAYRKQEDSNVKFHYPADAVAPPEEA